MSAVELEAAIRVADPPGRLAMILAHEAGLRAGAISTLCRHNLDFGRNELRGRTKNGANYAVPMTERVREVVLWAAAQAAPHEPLVAALAVNHARCRVSVLDRMVRRAKSRAGITSDWTLHDLRRTAARRVYERTRDVRKVQRLLSHKQLATTMWYLGDTGTELEQSDLETAHRTTKEEKTA